MNLSGIRKLQGGMVVRAFTSLRFSNLFFLLSFILLNACVGSGSQPGSSANGPLGALGGGQQAAPEMDSGVPAPIVDMSPCDPFFEGKYEIVEQLSAQRNKYLLEGFIKVPIKETKTYTLDNPEGFKHGETITKIECVGYRPAESGRVFRFILKNEKTYLDISLQDKIFGQGSDQEIRSGFVSIIFEGPAERSYAARLSPLAYAAGQQGVVLPCPENSEICIDNTGWERVFLPLTLFLNSPQLNDFPQHLEATKSGVQHVESVVDKLKVQPQPLETVHLIPKRMLIELQEDEDSESNDEDEDSEEE